MKALLFGTGEYYNRYKIWFADTEVIGLIDNSPDKQGTTIDQIPVYSPADAILKEFDTIFIMSFYIVEMKNQLISLGVDEHKIYHFYDIHDLIYKPSLKQKIYYYPIDTETVEKRGILLLNSDLTLGGPALALFYAARTLKKNGYNVTYGSQYDGPLRELLKKENIPVVVDANLLVVTMNESEWIRGYSLIICNTINYHIFLSERDLSIPTVWWLHDALFFYNGVNKRAINKILHENLQIWSVGSISEKAIKTFRPDFEVEELLYGVEEQEANNTLKHDTKVQFVTIGYIEERKGQDILVKAIKLLPEHIRKQAHFLFVGQNTSIYANKIMENVKDISEIEFGGLIDREKIYHVLKKTDMMICPSRVEDPMPTVCAEAMMFSVPCIISDAAGTAKYISNWKDGITFKSEDYRQLSQKIEWVISNRNALKYMGKNARKVYEDKFSMAVFEDRLMELIKKSASMSAGNPC